MISFADAMVVDFMHACPDPVCRCFPPVSFCLSPEGQAALIEGGIEAYYDLWLELRDTWKEPEV